MEVVAGEGGEHLHVSERIAIVAHIESRAVQRDRGAAAQRIGNIPVPEVYLHRPLEHIPGGNGVRIGTRGDIGEDQVAGADFRHHRSGCTGSNDFAGQHQVTRIVQERVAREGRGAGDEQPVGGGAHIEDRGVDRQIVDGCVGIRRTARDGDLAGRVGAPKDIGACHRDIVPASRSVKEHQLVCDDLGASAGRVQVQDAARKRDGPVAQAIVLAHREGSQRIEHTGGAGDVARADGCTAGVGVVIAQREGPDALQLQGGVAADQPVEDARGPLLRRHGQQRRRAATVEHVACRRGSRRVATETRHRQIHAAEVQSAVVHGGEDQGAIAGKAGLASEPDDPFVDLHRVKLCRNRRHPIARAAQEQWAGAGFCKIGGGEIPGKR